MCRRATGASARTSRSRGQSFLIEEPRLTELDISVHNDPAQNTSPLPSGPSSECVPLPQSELVDVGTAFIKAAQEQSQKSGGKSS